MEPFEVRRYEPGDEENILALFNRVLQADDPNYVPRTMATWRHRYIDNPMGYQVLVATNSAGEIIGNYSAMAMRCSVRGEKRRCAQAVDTVVDRAWRGALSKSSVFVTLGRRYLKEFCRPEGDTGNEYAYGLPNNQAFGAGTRILGYKPVHCPMPTQVMQFDEAWVTGLEQASGKVTITEDDWSSLDQVEQLFLEHLDQVPLGLWRDATYLAWRYRDWPVVRYRMLLAWRDGQLIGALIFSMGWFGQPIVPLMDWIGPGDDRECLSALVAHVSRLALSEGGSRLETWVTPNMPQLHTLTTMGFREEESPFNLCIMVYGRDFDLDWSAANWFFTMGDSDIY